MTDARAQRIQGLAAAALLKPPSERAAFLFDASEGDESIRHDVEQLLRSSTATGAETQWTDPSNIGPYRVISILGAGGMGQVFRAHDSKLNRDVALKVLPAAFVADPDRLARFAREAQVLASLNHPHIGAIYGLEESSGHPALVLELVEGRTLAQRIAQGPLSLRDALTMVRQIADALEAAHVKGIVHRDLKPANIKVTPAGVVKVLDFGLAKTMEADRATADASHSPTVIGSTRIGAVVGTAAYMSPEQTRGLPVDARTDVWAFGCVLFEMLTGRKAFGRDEASDSVAKILESEPEWQTLPKSTPASVRVLLRRCLQKDPNQRVATIGEARTVIDGALAPPRSLSRRAWATLGIAAVCALAAAVYLWTRTEQRPATNVADWMPLTRLDSVTQPALSPDGRVLAFIRGTSTFTTVGQVYVKLLPDGDPVALTHDDYAKMGPVFSPDGSRVAYTVNVGNAWDTWDVATLRGEPRRWLLNAAGLNWIAPGELLFSAIKSGNHMAIVRDNDSRTAMRDVYVPAHESAMAHRSYPSPDRTRALVVEMNAQGAWMQCRLVSLEGGPSQTVGPPGGRCTNAAWSPNGRWMYSSVDGGDGFHLWRQRMPDGAPEQLTFGATEEEGLAVAPDGRSLITSVGITQRSVWLHEPSGERQISLEGYAYFPSISADGRKVTFRVTRGVGSGQSASELWVFDMPTGRLERLFPGRLVTGYDLSRDDRVVAAISDADGQPRLWLSTLDSREPPRMIPDVVGDAPKFGPSGDIIFRASIGPKFFIHRIPESGGASRQIGEMIGNVLGNISPDGTWITGMRPENTTMTMSLFSTDGLDVRPVVASIARIRWSADGRYAYISFQHDQMSAFGVGQTYVVPVTADQPLPDIPDGGFHSESEIAKLPGVSVLPYGDIAVSSPDVYVFSRVTTTRNLYRIPLRD